MSTTSVEPRAGALGRLAAYSFRHRWLVLTAWLLAVVAAFGANKAFGGDFSADYTAKGSDSAAAQQLLEQRFSAQAGDTVDVVFRVPSGVSAQRSAIEAVLAKIDAVPHVAAVDDPFTTPGSISADGRTLLTKAHLDVVNPEDMPVEDAKAIIAIAEGATRAPVEMAVGGQSIGSAESGSVGSEGIGLAAAALILLLAFGSVVAAGLPILTAVLGLGVSSSLVGVVAAATAVPDWSTALASMMGIGVGIDYVLLLVTRYREQLAAGREPLRAVVATAETAGRSVMVAGTTVVISMLGLFGMGLSYMRGAALVTILAVLVVMASAVTAVPALLGAVGTKVNSLRLPGTGRRPVGHAGIWVRWSRTVQRRPVLGTLAGVGILVLLAAPLLGLRFGFPDSGNSADGTQTRRAYDLAAQGFGKGANGPLLLAAKLPAAGDTAALETLSGSLRTTPGVASVTPVVLSPDRSTAIMTVVPTTGPQDAKTETLVKHLRDSVVPAATASSGTEVHVGGVTASAIDSTSDVVKRLPLLVGGVVGLSMLLLLVAFRSVVVAVKAAVMNLLSILAAYGVVALVLQGGWAGQLIGIDTATPLPAFIPVLMFAILFGLSMDYEVFLLSRMRERWIVTGDNSRAVAEGLAGTARVITAAAAIMVAVFAAFVPAPDVILKVIGVGLATAIFVDATVVRMLLVPAVMQLLGRANWWMPEVLHRRLPNLHIEGRPEFHLDDEGEAGPVTLPGQRTVRVPV
ncbi:RND superfamily putative drug exporter [Motilibacter peucedani]|uniref:RND superfamily putative drug exporter n=1 Tax=Motilibacter peucedani TaxID=598650 RepID=A0A420XL47_9ACTN|nr:MMPL family transporter [Motilibacter peucedani]RKS69329.1 RND superfamily putative drug exporter [Motilibacter peucedani]